MTTIFFSAGAFILCLWAANRSLRYGLLSVMAIGYLYGILRANFPDTSTYVTFDMAVLGLYIGQLWRPLTPERRRHAHDLRLWLVALITWPVLLFFLTPADTPLVELVGLRANTFLLPFLLLGARLDDDDMFWLALAFAALNLAVVGVGIAEFFLGIEQGLPGLTLWVVFLLWTFLRWPRRRTEDWALGRVIAWIACALFFLTGLTGVGLMSSVPQTVLMLTLMGWFVTSAQLKRGAERSAAFMPAARPHRVAVAVQQSSVEPS